MATIMSTLFSDLRGEGYLVRPFEGGASALVQKAGSPWAWVWDNGGEVGVGVVNDEESSTFTPMPGYSLQNIGRLTFLARVLDLLNGRPVDYAAPMLEDDAAYNRYLKEAA